MGVDDTKGATSGDVLAVVDAGPVRDRECREGSGCELGKQKTASNNCVVTLHSHAPPTMAITCELAMAARNSRDATE